MFIKIITEAPETETWISQEYTEQDIARALRNLAKRKAPVSDGIPCEEYREASKWPITPAARILGNIKGGRATPGNWANGAIVYIYKNKGYPGECGNFGPICLPQIIYKIRPGLITRKLTKSTHILKRNNHFWIQRRKLRERCNNRNRTIYRTCRPSCQNPAHGPFQSLRRDKQDDPMGDIVQKRPTSRNDKTYQKRPPMTKTITEI